MYSASLSHRPAEQRAGISLSGFITRVIWLCILPLLLLAAGLAFEIVRETDSGRDQRAANFARNFATAIDHQLNARIAALTVLANSPLLDNAARREEFYKEALGFFHSFGSHVILADTGTPMRMLFNTRVPLGADLPLLPRPEGYAAAPTAIATGRPAVGDSFWGPIANESLVAIAVPALRGGRAAFLLLTIFETRQFRGSFDQMQLPPGWTLALIDGRGATIARSPQPPRNPETDPNDAARFAAKSEVSPWSVVLEVPAGLHRAPLISAAAALGAGILGATLFGYLGGRLAGRRLGRSVASLTQTPASEIPFPDIHEIAAARRLLDEAAAARAVAEDRLRQSEERLRLFIENAPTALAMFDHEMRYLAVSRRWMTDYHLDDRDIPGRSHYEIFPDIPKRWKAVHRRGLAGESVDADEDVFERSDGTVQWLRWAVRPWRRTGGAVGGIIIFTEDISERKRVELERAAVTEFLKLASTCSTTREMIQAATVFFQRQSGCEAVGVRLQEDGDYPYYEARGFPADFLKAENSLCARSPNGGIIRDAWNNPVLACMCGNVIAGRFDPAQPFFTAGGSFWTNSTSALLAATSEADRRGRTRNRCHGEGYESVALMPLVLGEERLGLMQLNDRRKGLFSAEGIALWERLAGYLAVTLAKLQSDEKLQRSRQTLRGYAAHLQQTIENERMRIARELHDDLGQRLSAMKMDLGWVMRRLLPDQQIVSGKLDEMTGLVAEGVQTIKSICADLRPGILEDLGLAAAMEWAVAGFRQRSGIAATLQLDIDGLKVEKSLALAVYRIVQEGLTNVARHAKASRVDVRLRHETGRLILEVQDDGRGLPAQADASLRSFGIIGMQERVRSFGGVFQLAPGQGGGTVLSAAFPLPPGAGAGDADRDRGDI